MLSSVLNSERAIEVNITIMRAFVKLRQMLESNEDLSRKFASVIRKLSTHDKYFKVVFDELKRLTQQYSLSEAAEAVRYVEEGHARGKVVIDCRSAREAGVSIEPGVERGFASATLGSRTQ